MQIYTQIRDPMVVNVCNEIEKYKNKFTTIIKKLNDNIILNDNGDIQYATYEYNEESKDLLSILIHDRDFYEFYAYYQDYIDAIYVLNTEEFKGVGLGTNEYPYLNVLFNRDNYNSFINNKVYSKYISYMINNDAKNFNELFVEKRNEYIKENFKNNSCFINAIIENYKEAFDAKKPDGRRKYKELTYDYLLNILDIENNREDNIGLSISRAVDKFFSKFNLGLDVISQDDILLYTYRPEKLNNNIKPQIMRIMITNNCHIILLNDQIKVLMLLKNY